MNVNLEVVSIPVSDVERALEFYRDRLGWRVDADIRGGGDVRVVQMTPTGEGHTSIASDPAFRWLRPARSGIRSL
jgi:catechol 2,3-dioxygenase-like lactoylglutathione lyase family enzyme